MTEKYDVTGMGCAACSARIETVIGAMDGVQAVQVNLLAAVMTVSHSEQVTPAEICAAVAAAGYGATLKEATRAPLPKETDGEAKKAKGALVALSVCAVLMVALMYLSMGPVWGLFMPAFLQRFLHAAHGLYGALLQLALCTPIVVLERRYFISGMRAVKNKAPNMDTLISIGAGAAILYSLWRTLEFAIDELTAAPAPTTHEMLYFESAAMILTLVSVGKYLEARAKGKTTAAIAGLAALLPTEVSVERDREIVVISQSQLQVGDILPIHAGDTIPTDGVLISGRGAVDGSAMTGESLPYDVEIGEAVTGGTLCADGFFRMRATAVGGETMLSRMIALVEDATSSKAPIARIADRASTVFVPSILIIAVGTVIGWLIWGASFAQALSNGIAVLVISCPCALGLATPTAITVGMGRGAQMGVLFKNAETLEWAGSIRHVLFDKTGTVTEGKPQVVAVYDGTGTAITEQTEPAKEMLTLVAAAEAISSHPLSAAILGFAGDWGLRLPTATAGEVLAGEGIRAMVGDVPVTVGNRARMQNAGVELPQALVKLAETGCGEGKIALYAAAGVPARPVGMFLIADPIKADAKAATVALGALGVGTTLLTGDRRGTANAIAAEAGIAQVIAQVLPHEKAEAVATAKAEYGAVAMVGDGINDAPALATADVGIAMGSGTDIAMSAAGCVLLRKELSAVPDAIWLSRTTVRVIRQNLFWALFYNSVCIPLAVAGVMHPGFAAAAMSLSSLTVVGNALRLLLIKKK